VQLGLQVELDAIVIVVDFGELMRCVADMQRGVDNCKKKRHDDCD